MISMPNVTQLTPIVFSKKEPVITMFKVTQLTPIVCKDELISLCGIKNHINIESNTTDPDSKELLTQRYYYDYIDYYY